MLTLAVLATGSAQAQTFTNFDAPGAGTGLHEGTIAIGINTAGTMTGLYLVNGDVAHGYVRASSDTRTTFSIAAAGAASNQGPFPVAINTAGTIAGMYFAENN